MIDEIREAYDNAESELRSTRRDLKNNLSDEGFEQLTDRVEGQVEQALQDVDKLAGVRQRKLNELDRAARRQGSDDPDIFGRVSVQLEIIHPEAIASDIQEATQFDGLVDNYFRFAENLQEGPIASKVASRYVLPEEVVRAMTSQCAVPFKALKEPLERHTEAVKDHIQEIDELTSSKLGKGIAAFANITSSLAMGAATSALTGSAFLGRSARKEASSGIGGWAAKKYFGPGMEDAMDTAERSFQQLIGEYEQARDKCERRLKLTAFTLYGGISQQLENDLSEADQKIGSVEWDTGLIDPELSMAGNNKFVSWAEKTAGQLEDLEEEEKWVRLGDAAESALQYSLENRSRSQATGFENGLAYTVIFARKRAKAMTKVAGEAWQQGEFVAAAQVYMDLLAGSPVGFDQNESMSATAGWRLALVGTSDRAPEGVRQRALDLLPFVQQVKVRKEARDGRYSIPGEHISRGAEETAALLEAFGRETETDLPDTDRRLPDEVDGGTNEGTAWADTNGQSVDFKKAFESRGMPEELQSKLSQWVREGKEKQDRRRWLIAGGAALAFVLVIAVLLFVLW